MHTYIHIYTYPRSLTSWIHISEMCVQKKQATKQIDIHTYIQKHNTVYIHTSTHTQDLSLLGSTSLKCVCRKKQANRQINIHTYIQTYRVSCIPAQTPNLSPLGSTSLKCVYRKTSLVQDRQIDYDK